MKQLVLTSPGDLSWHDAAEPSLPSAAYALVRPVAAATCDFDHLVVAGRMPLPMPIAIGHELVGEVVEVGGEVTGVQPGDVVAMPFQIACGTCGNCRRGLTTACEQVPWLSCYGLGALSGDWGGAVSDLVAVPWADAVLHRLPDNVRPEDAAAASCNIPDAYRAVAPQLGERPDARVFVTGGAFANISHYTVAIAKALGADVVDYYSPDAEQSAKAERLGARVLASPTEVEAEAYEITVDNSQDPDLFALAVRATAPAGTLTATTMYPDARTPVPLMDMFARAITFRTGQPHAGALLGDVLSLLADGRLDSAAVTTAVVPWDDAPEAWRAGSGKHVCVRH